MSFISLTEHPRVSCCLNRIKNMLLLAFPGYQTNTHSNQIDISRHEALMFIPLLTTGGARINET